MTFEAIDLLHRLERQSQIYLQNHSKLDKLLRWAMTSTEGSQGTYSPLAKRAAAVASVIAVAYNNKSDSTVIGADALTRRRYEEAITRAIISAYKIVNAIASRIASTILSLSTIGAKAIAASANVTFLDIPAIDIDINSEIDSASDYVQIFNNTRFLDLQEQLNRLAKPIPTDGDSSEAWQNWADALEVLWLDILGLDKTDLTFTLVEAKAVQRYLSSIELLLHCKEATIRIPKQAWADLEAHLLTPHSLENGSP